MLSHALSADAYRRNPGPAPHVVIDPLNHGLNLGQDLDTTRAAIDQSDPFSGQVICGIVRCRMDKLALEVVQAGDIGPSPLVQEAGRGADDFGCVCEFL